MSRLYDALKAARERFFAMERDGPTDEHIRAAQLAVKRALKVLGNGDLYHETYPALSDPKRAEASKNPAERMGLIRSADAYVGVALGHLSAAEGRS